jgi:hypothetical protein
MPVRAPARVTILGVHGVCGGTTQLEDERSAHRRSYSYATHRRSSWYSGGGAPPLRPTAGAPGRADEARRRRNSWLSVESCGWTDTAESDGGRWRRTARDGDDGQGGRRGERREALDLISDKMDQKGEE